MRKKKSNARTKRIVAAVIVFLLVLTMLLSAAASFVWGASQKDMLIEVKGGVNSYYKAHDFTRISIVATNSGANFDGEIIIKNPIISNTNGNLLSLHSYPLEIPSNGSKKVEMDVVLSSGIFSLNVVAVDKSGIERGLGTVRLSEVSPESPLAICLSDTFDSARYLRQLSFNSGYYNAQEIGSHFVELDALSFPDNPALLKCINYIVINNFDTASLSEKQMTALKTWVLSGGLLLLGSGGNFDKVLGGFPPDFIELKSGVLKNVTSLQIAGAPVSDKPISNLNLMSHTFDSAPGIEVVSSDGKPVIISKIMERGKVIVSGFDLGSSNPAAAPNDKSNAVLGILTALITKNLPDLSADAAINNNSDNLKYTLDSIPNLSSSILLIIAIIVGFYIFVFLLAVFFILKAVKKRHMGLWIIPLSALVFTGIVLAISSTSPYKLPFLNSITTVKLYENSSTANTDINIGVFSPKSGAVKVNFTEPALFYTDYTAYQYMSFDNNFTKDVVALKIKNGEYPELTFYDSSPWEKNFFRTNEVIKLPGELETNFQYDGINIFGTITNNTGYDFDTVLIDFAGDLSSCPAIKSGETENFHFALTYKNFAWGGEFLINVGELNNTQPFFNTTGSSNSLEAERLSTLRNDIYSNYYSSFNNKPSLSGGSTKKVVFEDTSKLAVKILAFSSDKMFKGDVSVNGKKPNETNVNFFVMDNTINISDGKVIIPFGVITPYQLSTSSSFNVNPALIVNMDSAGDFFADYKVPENLTVSSFSFETSSIQGSIKRGNIQIYNNKTSAWDDLKQPFTENQINSYINSDNFIKLRANMDDYSSFNPPPISLTVSKVGTGVVK